MTPESDPAVPHILLPLCRDTELRFGEQRFTVQYCGQRVRVSRDARNFSVLSLKDQRVAYKVQLLGSMVMDEQSVGDPGWSEHFSISWEDQLAAPELVFLQPPTRISRSYEPGQAIELGLDPVARYDVVYADGTEAVFQRREEGGFVFSFSTGFRGSFWKEADGAWLMRFKGDRLPYEDDGMRAQSKFIVSRSRYSDNLLLYFQDGAQVRLSQGIPEPGPRR